MTVLRRFFVKTGCSVGAGLRDAEPLHGAAELWLTTREPHEILEISRFVRRRRLPVSKWLVGLSQIMPHDAEFLVELAKSAREVDVRVPRAAVKPLVAALRATRCLDVTSRIRVSPHQ
ncbi:MAG: hypothetical protein R3E66_10230 [bacterium]